MPIPLWYSNFISALISSVPDDLDENTAESWIANQEGMKKILLELVNSAPSGSFRIDKTTDGWELIRDNNQPTQFRAQQLSMTAFAEGIEDIIGDPMVNMILEMESLLGQWHAEYAIDHQDHIPDQLQKFSLVFPGTIWRSPDGNHQVPCITYRQGQWDLIFGILEGGFDSRDKLASLNSK
tara:strand:+ start:760 stop:1302 length:543 start_codon:yes stop_codon:yes gene_type:complete